MTRARYRIRFAKVGLLRWISHHDLMRLWERLLRRAELPLSMTEGFHPKPRMNFPSALALGIPGEDEVLELDLSVELAAEEVERRLVEDHQPGLQILQVVRVPEGTPKAQMARAVYRLTIPSEYQASMPERIRRLLEQDTLRVEREKKSIDFDLKTEVAALEFVENSLLLTLNASRQTSLRPSEVVQALGLAELLTQGEFLTRVRVELEHHEQLQDAK